MSHTAAADKVVQALQIVLEQRNAVTEQQTICTLMRVSHSLRAAVQQCQSGMIRLQLLLETGTALQWLEKLAGFASWLPKNQGIVRALIIKSNWQSKQTSRTYKVAASLLALSLQQAAAGMLRSWQLQTQVLSRDILLAVPPASLTALHYEHTEQGDWSCFTPALGRLTGLQELILDVDTSELIPGSIMFPIAQLQSLTRLRLEGMGVDCELDLLPTQLRELEVITYTDQPLLYVMGHLTCLQTVELHNASDSAADIQQVQDLAPALDQLQHVTLKEPSLDTLFRTAPIWKQLPNLLSLMLAMQAVDLQLEEFLQLEQHIGGATTLTKLSLAVGLEEPVPYDAAHLTGQVNLQSLELIGVDVSAAGAQHLAQLTALSHLAIHVMDDGVLTMLALKLPSLQSLRIWRRAGLGVGPMPVVGQLARLQSLSVNMVDADAAKQSLCYLTGLKQLTRLYGFTAAGPEALDAFCAAIGRVIQCYY